MSNPFKEIGFSSPWDSKDDPKYIKLHQEAIIIIVIFLIVEGIVITFLIFRYPMDGVTSTILMFSLLWMLSGSGFIWYLWIHGKKVWATLVFILFVIGNCLVIGFTLELRYQQFYSKFPSMIDIVRTG